MLLKYIQCASILDYKLWTGGGCLKKNGVELQGDIIFAFLLMSFPQSFNVLKQAATFQET